MFARRFFRRFFFLSVFLAFLLALVFSIPFTLFAETADELKQQIQDHQAQMDALNKEIQQYEQQLQVVGAKKQTLQGTLSQIDLSLKKTTASINVTSNKISTTQLQLKQLEGDIGETEQAIAQGEAGISESLRKLNDLETEPLAIQMLAAENLSEIWGDTDASEALQKAVQVEIANLSQQKVKLTGVKEQTEGKKTDLVKQQHTLVSQKGSLDSTKKTQASLLSETKAQESNYQKIIAEKKRQEAAFENALTDLNARLQVAVNPSDITPVGKGILQWPLDNVRITQKFGNTAFAAAGAYNGKGHNGIDFAASIGTPLKAALSGTVVGTGNTDATRGCYSFGKWVMIKHANGLSTMYAHLSHIDVSQGEQVLTGDVIGYSGETGYATGPHLHFGVYVSSATQIIKLGDATNKSSPCSGVVMPVAPLSGYLDPLSYL